MTSGAVSLERPPEIRAAELLLIGGVVIDSAQRMLQFNERMDGVGTAIGIAVAIAGPILCIGLIFLATRLRSRIATCLVLTLVAFGAAISVADYIIQGEPTLGWLMGWTALALQVAAAPLLVSRSARSWLAQRAAPAP